MTLQLHDEDFTTIEQFGRRWRFTDARHQELPPDVLTRLRPLRSEVAGALMSRSSELCRAPLATGLRISAAGEDNVVRRALSKLPVSPGTAVLVHWDAEDALVTEWAVFVEYWAAFCYPASDDVTIWPIAGTWVLCYDHEEHFTFMSQRAAG